MNRPQVRIEQDDFRHTLNEFTCDVDLILTDIPYNISRETGFQNLGPKSIERFAVNMDFGRWDKEEINLNDLATDAYHALRDGGTFICFYDIWKISYMRAALERAKFQQIRLVIWEKTNPVPLNSGVNYLTNPREIAVLGVRKGKPTFNGRYHRGVYRHPIPHGDRHHPTQKPRKLFAELIETHTNPGNLVVDPFLGSGTTALACLDTKRRFIGGDIDKVYVEIAKERIKNEQTRIHRR